ncbi:hypothetical protein BDV96DRAFT_649525 [Lophiotrema nucula]|uniref:PPP4R2-domain-containing protein n=1 Tax=Lophiotrema nucula TaxID=690887 RepID=A0A6A5YYD4_9PLEO|nr:hypothetical protein BDV96DRAFT_649525 [Lophiotrema nucula]
MLSTEQVLQQAADDGSLESDEWPRALEYILTRLDEIVRDFPKPAILPDPPSSTSDANTPVRPSNAVSSQESQTADKENAPPATPPRPPVPTFAGTRSDSQPEIEGVSEEVQSLYKSIRTALSKTFAKNPPHTIQRLAELILQPKQRYRFLPSYLRALDRVVSVSSPSTIFPLPLAVLPNAGLLNGAAPTPSSMLGSDESLGGALLTPIPWLQNRQNELISESTEMVDGPLGAGRIETVTVMNGSGGTPPTLPSSHHITSAHPEGESLPDTGAVTQGEILRQEQEAGIVLSNPHSIQPNRTILGEVEGGGTIMDTVEGEEELPHARGPEIIGMEDTGPQRTSQEGLDIEGAVGRPSIRNSKSPGPTEEKKEDEGMTDEAEKDEKEEAKDAEDDKPKEDEDMKSD